MQFFSSSAGRFSWAARCAYPATLLAAGLLLAGCKEKEPEELAPVAPAAVVFTQAGLYPEGVQYDGTKSYFLVSSQTKGAIGEVKDDGTYTTFADNPALISTIGINLDEPRDRLLVAISDPGYNTARTNLSTKGKLAQLAIFDRNNPQSTPTVLDLGGLRPAAPGHFANDIAVDAQGNAYVTDSFAPIIYKITPRFEVTVFTENPLFSAPANTFGLNGIVYHPDGYLLVAKSNTGVLFKVPLSNPTNVTTVDVGSQNLQGADGMRLQDNNTLQVACNAQAKVYRLAGTNAWANATVSGTFNTPPQYPTTLAHRDHTDGYVLYSNLNALQASLVPPVSQFTIAQVGF